MTKTAAVSDKEEQIALQLGDIWNRYLELPIEHPMEQDEFCRGIHVLQHLVLCRAGRRAINGGTS